MALFVQIDHFRKTDQKPTVKNHLFSISWFRSFNRTSFQQQLKLSKNSSEFNLSKSFVFNRLRLKSQQYILLTTTETRKSVIKLLIAMESQQYILLTTTETLSRLVYQTQRILSQQYILLTTTETNVSKAKAHGATVPIVHSSNNY